MAPMSLPEPTSEKVAGHAPDAALLAAHGERLLALARASIAWRLREGARFGVDLAEHPPELQAQRAVFVTLSQDGRLRGCVGSALAWRPLVTDVAENAAAAALEDWRFAPLAAHELEEIGIALSLLSAPLPLEAASESELLARLEPGIDGLILREGQRQALFLPQVWQQLAEPREFLAQLKAKAGLPGDYWSSRIEFRRFTSSSVAEPGAERY
jgi:AmmeMemoRadiSam system protein A